MLLGHVTGPLRGRGNLCLHQRAAVHDLIAVNLQAAKDLAKGQFGTQRLDLTDLARECQAMRVSGINWPLAGVEVRAVRAVVRQ